MQVLDAQNNDDDPHAFERQPTISLSGKQLLLVRWKVLKQPLMVVRRQRL